MHQAMATVLGDVRFHELLLRMDQDLAAAVRVRGCASCRAVLHSARYARKPRGVPAGVGEDYCQCLSLCCARDGCRQRTNPPSLRFLGRKVYLCAMVVLVSAMRLGSTPTRMGQLQSLVGVSPRTVLRWRQWWREVFTRSAFWRVACADFMPPVETSELPASLLERFTGTSGERLIALLRFLSPLATGVSAMRAL
jgi:hypothetical protein